MGGKKQKMNTSETVIAVIANKEHTQAKLQNRSIWPNILKRITNKRDCLKSSVAAQLFLLPYFTEILLGDSLVGKS
ncbi:hypothetical protein P8452_25654 [Trifolium repens]|nr:hypothetical protein P8452_20293 [Trifolium repens]WJX37942.1 hypothetical protein P8452_25654 [Trifolium repens]